MPREYQLCELKKTHGIVLHRFIELTEYEKLKSAADKLADAIENHSCWDKDDNSLYEALAEYRNGND
jgi:hypothetical protein